MKYKAKVPYKFTTFVFVESHYDHNLAGLCQYKGKLCRFTCRYGSDYCRIWELSFFEKLKALYTKKTFEWFVGRHWTYPDRPNGARYNRREGSLRFKFYYKFLSPKR